MKLNISYKDLIKSPTAVIVFSSTVIAATIAWSIATVSPKDECMIKEQLHAGLNSWDKNPHQMEHEMICNFQILSGNTLYKTYADALPKNETFDTILLRDKMVRELRKLTNKDLENLMESGFKAK